MNKIILRFYVVKTGEVFEAVFDQRLSFLENFDLLATISPYTLGEDNYVVDIDRHEALKKDIPISSFGLSNFMTFILF